jgi:AcrR family transcriptional regulator
MTRTKLRQLERMQAEGTSVSEIAAALSVGRATVYRHLQQTDMIA